MPSLVPRDSYAALERCTYFNQAALGLVPIPAVEAMHAFMERTAQHGNLYLSDEQEAEILDGVRSAGAELLGTSLDAVAVVGGASEGLGQIASLLEADRGTVVLVSTDFPSVTYPWLAAAQRREIELRFVEDRPDRDLTNDLVDAIDPTTSVVTFGAVQYATGSQVDVGRVAARAHDAGARVVVDATQLAGAGPRAAGHRGGRPEARRHVLGRLASPPRHRDDLDWRARDHLPRRTDHRTRPAEPPNGVADPSRQVRLLSAGHA